MDLAGKKQRIILVATLKVDTGLFFWEKIEIVWASLKEDQLEKGNFNCLKGNFHKKCIESILENGK